MNFKPLHDRIAVLPVPSEEKTTGGIIIPDTAKEKPMQGKVVAIGNGLRDKDGKLVPLEVKVGDIVMYGKWGGTEVKVDGKDIVIMKESDVMGIIVKNSRTGERTKFRNPIYEEVRHLRGNQPKLQYQYLTLRHSGKLPEYLKFYPESKAEFSVYRDNNC